MSEQWIECQPVGVLGANAFIGKDAIINYKVKDKHALTATTQGMSCRICSVTEKSCQIRRGAILNDDYNRVIRA